MKPLIIDDVAYAYVTHRNFKGDDGKMVHLSYWRNTVAPFDELIYNKKESKIKKLKKTEKLKDVIKDKVK